MTGHATRHHVICFNWSDIWFHTRLQHHLIEHIVIFTLLFVIRVQWNTLRCILVARGRCVPAAQSYTSHSSSSPRQPAAFTSGRLSRCSSIAIRFPSLRSRPGRSVAAEETPESRALRRRLVPGHWGAASLHSRSHMTRAPPMVVHGAERSPSVRHLRAEVASLANVS